jgi:hypothetical protein
LTQERSITVFPGAALKDVTGCFPEVLTLTIQLAVFPPSATTVISVDPAETAVTSPDPFTVATEGYCENHETVVIVALGGFIIGVN